MEPSIATAIMKVAAKLIGINASPLLWFIGGAALTLVSPIWRTEECSMSTMHLYVNEQNGCSNARFDHTDAIFRRHNGRVLAFASARRAVSANPCVHPEHLSREEAVNTGPRSGPIQRKR